MPGDCRIPDAPKSPSVLATHVRESRRPARSNIFQRLVAEIHKDLGPGWHVSESRFLTHRVTNEPREVDVVAEATVGGYPLFISVEVRDQSRRGDVSWVESALKKHEFLPTSKLVLWSSKGFSKNALALAKTYGIETVTPGPAEKVPWATIARQLIGGSVKFLRPKFEPSVDVTLEDGTMERWTMSPEMHLRDENGALASIAPILDQIKDHPSLRTTLLDRAPAGSGVFHAIYTLPIRCTVTGPQNVTATFRRLVIGITTECEFAPVVARSVLHEGRVTTLAEAILSDGKLEIVVRETEQGKVSTVATHRCAPEKKVGTRASGPGRPLKRRT